MNIYKVHNVYLAEEIAHKPCSKQVGANEWAIARPERYTGIVNRLKMCWLVLTDKCDLVRWYKQ